MIKAGNARLLSSNHGDGRSFYTDREMSEAVATDGDRPSNDAVGDGLRVGETRYHQLRRAQPIVLRPPRRERGAVAD